MSFKKVVNEQVCVSDILDAMPCSFLLSFGCVRSFSCRRGKSASLLEERTLALLAFEGLSVHLVARLNFCMPCLLSHQSSLPPYLFVIAEPMCAGHKP